MRWFSRRSSDCTIVTEAAPVSVAPPRENPLSHHAAGARRDAFIVDLVSRFGMLTSHLIVQRLALEDFGAVHSHHNALNRLKILTDRKAIYRIGHTPTGGKVYAPKPLRSKRPHIAHDLSVARFGVSLEIAIRGDIDWCCDQSILHAEAKDGTRPCVPEARFTLKGMQHYLELHTGSQDSERIILAKTDAYKRHQQQLKECARIDPSISTQLRVLFICQHQHDVARIECAE